MSVCWICKSGADNDDWFNSCITCDKEAHVSCVGSNGRVCDHCVSVWQCFDCPNAMFQCHEQVFTIHDYAVPFSLDEWLCQSCYDQIPKYTRCDFCARLAIPPPGDDPGYQVNQWYMSSGETYCDPVLRQCNTCGKRSCPDCVEQVEFCHKCDNGICRDCLPPRSTFLQLFIGNSGWSTNAGRFLCPKHVGCSFW
jgi:hypothetical protein